LHHPANQVPETIRQETGPSQGNYLQVNHNGDIGESAMAATYASIRTVLLTTAFVLLAGFGAPAVAAPLPVFVSIQPQKQMVQQIGGDAVNVQVMVPPGAEPHTYEPKPSQLAALTRTRIYFSVGVPFERKWLPKFTAINGRMEIIATDQGIQKLPMTYGDHDEEGTEGDASRLDPHTWLSPPLIKIMARNIRAALVKADPSHADHYDRHYAIFLHQLDSLDQRIRHLLTNEKGAGFMVFHPSWGYFARTYGLVQIPIEIEGKEPKPAQLQHMMREARSRNIQAIFAQPEFSTRSVQVIAEAIGARVVKADPLASDSMEQLLRLAEAIETNTREKNQ
jgi:zinc transport system substrate-binding protein